MTHNGPMVGSWPFSCNAAAVRVWHACRATPVRVQVREVALQTPQGNTGIVLFMLRVRGWRSWFAWTREREARALRIVARTALPAHLDALVIVERFDG